METSASDLIDRIRVALAGRDAAPVARSAGIPASTMQSIMTGTIPRADNAVKLARALGCSVEWLMTGEGDPPRPPVAAAEPMARFEGAPEEVAGSIADRYRQALIDLEEATQATGIIPDDGLREVLVSLLFKHRIPVEDVILILRTKARKGPA